MVPGPPTEDAAMKVQVEMEALPFTIPNYVLAINRSATGDEERISVPLKSLTSRELYGLCQEFVDRVYASCGREAPTLISDQD